MSIEATPLFVPVWAVADLDCEFCDSCGSILDGGRCPNSLAAVIERLEREFLLPGPVA